MTEACSLVAGNVSQNNGMVGASLLLADASVSSNV
jgi:hypothetical protein